MEPAVLVEAGLYDPLAPDAAQRLALIEHLEAQGVGLDEMVAANRRGRLVFAVSDRLLFPDERRQTLEQVAHETSMAFERIARVRTATGLAADPQTVVFPGFADVLDAFENAANFFGEAPTLALTRVMGDAVRRVVESATTLFSAEVAAELTSESEFAVATEFAQGLAATIPPVLQALLWEHWLALTENPAAFGTAEAHAGEVRTFGIAFVDLTGSTAWTESLQLAEHAAALARFDAAAWDAAVAHGARVVKMIGDAAMLVSADLVSLLDAALELCRAIESDEALPKARGAVGFGPMLSRQGDYFGSVVNLASRSVKLAEPGSVVVTEDARRALLDAGWQGELQALGARPVDGFSDPVVVHRVL